MTAGETPSESSASAAQSAPTPVPRFRFLRRALRFVARLCGWIVLVGMAVWTTLAVLYSNSGTSPRKVLATLVAIAAIGMLFALRPRRWGKIAFLALFAGVVIWFFSIKPRSDRDWQPDVARAPYATFNGDLVTIHDIRNFDYRSETDFTPAYYDKTYDLSKIRSTDYIVSFWGPTAIAHSLASFGFDNGKGGSDYLCFSIETRKEKGEEYSALQGFFRQYELIYVIADERDVIRLRTNYRKENVYVLRTRMSQKKSRAVFLDYLKTVNALHEKPQFYNALTGNCVTGLFMHVRSYPPVPKFTLGVVLNGYSVEYAYRNGGFDQSIPLEELMRRSHINEAAQAADQDPDFSNKIREGRPNPPVLTQFDRP